MPYTGVGACRGRGRTEDVLVLVCVATGDSDGDGDGDGGAARIICGDRLDHRRNTAIDPTGVNMHPMAISRRWARPDLQLSDHHGFKSVDHSPVSGPLRRLFTALLSRDCHDLHGSGNRCSRGYRRRCRWRDRRRCWGRAAAMRAVGIAMAATGADVVAVAGRSVGVAAAFPIPGGANQPDKNVAVR